MPVRCGAGSSTFLPSRVRAVREHGTAAAQDAFGPAARHLALCGAGCRGAGGGHHSVRTLREQLIMRALILLLPPRPARCACRASCFRRRTEPGRGSAAPGRGRIPSSLRRGVDRARRPDGRREPVRLVRGGQSQGRHQVARRLASVVAPERSRSDFPDRRRHGSDQARRHASTGKFAGDKAPLLRWHRASTSSLSKPRGETGGREVVRVPFEWPAKSAQALTGKGSSELGTIALNLDALTAARPEPFSSNQEPIRTAHPGVPQ